MRLTRTLGSLIWLGILALSTRPAPGATLWSVGTRDDTDREFALAPGGYNRYTTDGFVVVGRSTPQADWPYVQPGPDDAWGGRRTHTFTVAFGLSSPPASGTCLLRLNLLDAQSQKAPRLSIAINGKAFARDTEPGPGDESVLGNPAAGRRQNVEVSFPAALLRTGMNEVSITTVSGSWMLYDALSLETPGGTLQDLDLTRVDPPATDPVLVRRANGLRQVIRIPIRHYGPPTRAKVRVGTAIVDVPLETGLKTVEMDIPAVSARRRLAVQVTLEGGRSLPAAMVTVTPVRKMTVYLLAHSHVDIGYTARQADVMKKQFANLETAIDLARRTAGYPEGSRFKWNAEVTWAVVDYLKQAPPAKRAAFIDAVKRGWIELDGLYGNELTALCRPVELVHLVTPSLEAAAKTGVPIHSAMITDVPGYTWGLIPVLAQSGVRYFSFGPNGGDRIGPTIEAWGDKPFYWMSPGGDSSVLCWMAGTGYSWFHGQTLAQRGDAELLAYVGDLQRRGYPYDMVQVRYTTHGDNGSPDETLSDAVKAWNERYAYPRLVIATTTEMFRAFEARYRRVVPRVRGDFTPYWEDGAASSALETGLNREAAERLAQAETLWTLRGPQPFPRDALDEAWRNVVLYDEHTWGAWNSISDPDADFAKSQWAVKRAFAVDADRQSRDLLQRAAGRHGEPRTNAIDVYNTSSWPRTGLVTAAQSRAGDRVIGPDGRPVPSQRLASRELAFLARGVPAFGAARYTIRAGNAPASGSASVYGRTLSASALSVRLDGVTGAIVELKDRSGRNLARSLNEYRYVAGRDPASAAGVSSASVTVLDRGPLVATVRVVSQAPGCRSLTRDISVVDGLDHVTLNDVIDKTAVRAKEGVHIGFAFDIANPVVRLDTPWAVVRPETDQLAGACRNWFTIQRWADVSNARAGVTVATIDAPLLEVGGITAELPWMKHTRSSATLFSYVMNNYWHTNYKADQEGPTPFRYALRAHGPFDALRAARFGVEVSQPLVAVPATGPAPSAPRLRVVSDGAIVSSIHPAPDGKALIIRLFGASGAPARATVTGPGGASRTLYRSDLFERRGERIPGAVTVPGWGMVTLRVE